MLRTTGVACSKSELFASPLSPLIILLLHLSCVGPGITYCDVSVAPRTPAPWDAREHGSEVLAHIRPCEAPHVRHRSLFPVIGTEHFVQRLVHSNPRHCTSPPNLATTSLAQGCGDVSVITIGTLYHLRSTDYYRLITR